MKPFEIIAAVMLSWYYESFESENESNEFLAKA